MFTVGVDLAAQPAATAVAQIEWANAKATLTELKVGVTDQDIVSLSLQSFKTGIDCALGWPVEFVNFLNNHTSGIHQLNEDFGSSQWRRSLSYRETDYVVRELTKRWPLSVSTDRLGVTALRCAGLLARLQAAGIDTDRSGSQGVVEVYPAATLKLWQLNTAGYRDSVEIRSRLVSEVQQRAPWFELATFRELIEESCDAFDAVVAALATRAAAVGKASTPTASQLARARIEGWIALPLVELQSIVE